MAEACTCTIRNHGRVIEFCPMHKAAAEIRKELEKVTELLEHWAWPGNKVLSGAMRVVALGHAASAQAALAAARGREVEPTTWAGPFKGLS